MVFPKPIEEQTSKTAQSLELLERAPELFRTGTGSYKLRPVSKEPTFYSPEISRTRYKNEVNATRKIQDGESARSQTLITIRILPWN